MYVCICIYTHMNIYIHIFMYTYNLHKPRGRLLRKRIVAGAIQPVGRLEDTRRRAPRPPTRGNGSSWGDPLTRYICIYIYIYISL